jgi:hypothetical protein
MVLAGARSPDHEIVLMAAVAGVRRRFIRGLNVHGRHARPDARQALSAT